MIEVDLVPNGGPSADVIVSIAQADPDVWVNLAAQANAIAAQQGFTIVTGPLYNSPERTLASIVDVQNWLASQSNVGAKLARTSSTTSRALVIGLVGVGLLAVAAIVAATRPKR